MYERSANLLEKFFNNILGTNEEINVKVLYKEYKELVEETKKYEELLESEDKIINEFDEIANKIRDIQKEQNKLYNTNISLEEERNQLFNTLDEEPDVINSKLGKIEEKCKKNNRRLEELREEFVKLLTEFNIRQKDRNKHSKNRRMEEKNHIQIIEKVTKDMNNMNENIIQNMKSFISVNSEEKKKQITNLMN